MGKVGAAALGAAAEKPEILGRALIDAAVAAVLAVVEEAVARALAVDLAVVAVALARGLKPRVERVERGMVSIRRTNQVQQTFDLVVITCEQSAFGLFEPLADLFGPG